MNKSNTAFVWLHNFEVVFSTHRFEFHPIVPSVGGVVIDESQERLKTDMVLRELIVR